MFQWIQLKFKETNIKVVGLVDLNEFLVRRHFYLFEKSSGKLLDSFKKIVESVAFGTVLAYAIAIDNLQKIKGYEKHLCICCSSNCCVRRL